MDYRTLGRSGCAVSTLCLGTMTFGAETDEAGSHAQLDRFVEAGGTLVDTADVYSAGISEEIIGRWLADRPADVTEPVVLATKGRFPTDNHPNGTGLTTRHLTRALDASLRRLGVDSVDLYQVHAFDPWTPLEETLRTLDGFIRAGKIRYYGLSNFTGWQLTKAVYLARALNLAEPITLQPQYNLLVREIEWEIVPAVLDIGMGLLPWSPLGGTGGGGRKVGDEFAAFGEIAADHGVSPQQVVLAWELSLSEHLIPIPGARRPESIIDSAQAADLVLSAEELARCSATGGSR